MSTTTTDLLVGGMTCASCVARVEKRLNRLDGVHASVNLATASAKVEHPPEVDVAALIGAVERAGYTASPRHDETTPATTDDRRLGPRVAVAIPLTIAVLVLAMVPGVPRLPWVQLVLTLPVWGWAGWPFHRAALAGARHLTSTMDTLVSLGTTVALGWSVWELSAGGPTYFEAAATVTTFLALGRWLEARARTRAGSSLRALLELGAERAVVVGPDGTETDTAVEALHPGTRVIVRPGGSIPVDGVVVEGTAAVDEALVTGESLPVDRAPGDAVVGGTTNLDGRLIIEVSRVGGDTVLAGITAAVLRAQATKAPVQRLADRVSAYFVPAVLVLAVATLAGWLLAGATTTDAIRAAVAVLVVACPCALGLATPMAMLVGTTWAARRGILVRDAAVLERVRRIDAIALDKTGTLTTGAMSVHRTAGDPAAWGLAAAVESGSEHPIGRALAAYAEPAGRLTGFRARPGVGVDGEVELADGSTRLVRVSPAGNRTLPDELAAAAEAARGAGETAVVVDLDGEPVAIAAVGDTIRPGAAQAVRRLHRLGSRVVMLTGDHAGAADKVAAALGIDEVVADVRPEEKTQAVERLQGEGAFVAMVGDGINDAAALATADLAIAVGSGTRVAIETADLVLVNDDPGMVPEALRMSRRTLRTIRQNLAWAFGYNVLMIPLAISGRLDPMIAGAAMAASSLCVVGNSLRLRR